MAKRLFVGNLPYTVTDAQLGEIFAGAGKVDSAKVITDRMTGQGRGFGFVEMSSDEEADAAVKAYNGFEVEGRKLIVNEARPMADRPSGGGGGGGPRRDFDRGRGGGGGGGRGGFNRGGGGGRDRGR